MPTQITLLTLTANANQSEFPSLYNSNVEKIKNAINELVVVSESETTLLASISGSLSGDIQSVQTQLKGVSGQLETQISNITNSAANRPYVDEGDNLIKVDVAAVSASVSGNLVKIESISSSLINLTNSVSGNITRTEVASVSAYLDTQIDGFVNINNLSAISGALNSEIQSLNDSNFSTTTLVSDISSALQQSISNNTTLVSTTSASLSSDISAISGQLNNKVNTSEVTGIVAGLGGTPDNGTLITSSTTISGYNLAYPVSLSDDEVVILGGSPLDKDRAIFYDIGDNVNTNTLTISASNGFTYDFRDNGGVIHLERRNGTWYPMYDLDTKFTYDSNGDIIANPVGAGIIASKIKTGSTGSSYKITTDSVYTSIGTNVSQEDGYFVNGYTPGISAFNDGNYNTGEYTPYPVTALSHSGANNPWKAFDGSITPISGGWVSTNNLSDWISIDLGNNNAKRFVGVRWFNANVDADRPKNVSIQASNDYLYWDTLTTIDNDSTPVGSWSNLYSFSNDSDYRFYRFNVHESQGNKVRIVELDFREGSTSDSLNTFTFNAYDGPVTGISPATAKVLDHLDNDILTRDKVQVSYSINDGAFSPFIDLIDFRLLEAFNLTTKLDISLKLVGTTKYSGFSIEDSSSYITQTPQQLSVVSDGSEVASVNSTGTIKSRSGEFGLAGAIITQDTLDFTTPGISAVQTISGWSGDSFSCKPVDNTTTSISPSSLTLKDYEGNILSDYTIDYNINNGGLQGSYITPEAFKLLSPDLFAGIQNLELSITPLNTTNVFSVELTTPDNIIKMYPSGDFQLESNGQPTFRVRSDGVVFANNGRFGLQGAEVVVSWSDETYSNVGVNVDDQGTYVQNVSGQSTDNEFDFAFHNGSATTFAPGNLVFRDKDGYVINNDDVTIDYALDGGSFQGSFITPTAFRALSDTSFQNLTQLDFRFKIVGVETLSSVALRGPDVLLELTPNGEVQILDGGNQTVRFSKDGLSAYVGGQWVSLSDTAVSSDNVSGPTEIVDSFDETLGDSVEWLVTIKDGTNFKTSKVFATWDGNGNVNYSQIGTKSIGDTSPVTISVDESSDNIRLISTIASGTWTIKAKRTIV